MFMLFLFSKSVAGYHRRERERLGTGHIRNVTRVPALTLQGHNVERGDPGQTEGAQDALANHSNVNSYICQLDLKDVAEIKTSFLPRCH